MNTNININKGETNVKTDESTMLHKTNIVDVNKSELKRSGRGSWSDFELMGESNKTEGEYQDGSMNEAAVGAFEKRLKHSAVGRKILSMKSLKLEAA